MFIEQGVSPTTLSNNYLENIKKQLLNVQNGMNIYILLSINTLKYWFKILSCSFMVYNY